MTDKLILLRDAIASRIAADAALGAWVTATLNGATLAVLKGRRLADRAFEAHYPMVVVSVGPDDHLYPDEAGGLRVVQIPLLVGVNEARQDPENGENNLLNFTGQVAALFDGDGARLDGLGWVVSHRSKPDITAWPKLHVDLTLTVHYEP